jgi:hypothetical protein
VAVLLLSDHGRVTCAAVSEFGGNWIMILIGKADTMEWWSRYIAAI